MTEGMLFDKSPVQDEDGKKQKKESKRPQSGGQDLSSSHYLSRLFAAENDFLVRSLDCVSCDKCGAPADLEYVFEIQGIKTWQVRCGWLCLHSWCIEEIPGVLNSGPKTQAGSFRMHSGRFAGKTLAEIWDAGQAWYVEGIASGVVHADGNRAALSAARKFVMEKTG